MEISNLSTFIDLLLPIVVLLINGYFHNLRICFVLLASTHTLVALSITVLFAFFIKSVN